MIIVLLLFFTSLCVYCQRLVLHVHDRWINPKNARLLKEADETSSAATRKLLLEQYRTGGCVASKKQARKRNSATNACDEDDSTRLGGILAESCRFCANSPQGYCRHHFHLQELELQKVQKQQQHTQLQTQTWTHFWQTRFWETLTLCCGSNTSDWEYITRAQRRQQRKESRELRRNLKNRLNGTTSHQHQQQQPLHPMQKQFQLQRQFLRRQQYVEYEELMRARNSANNSQSSNSSSSNSSSPLWDTSASNSSSGYQSPFASVYNVNGSLSELDTVDSGLTTSIESIVALAAEEQESLEESPQVLFETVGTPDSTITTTYL